MVTTETKKWPKMGQNSIISLFCPKELENGLHSGPYLQVWFIDDKSIEVPVDIGWYGFSFKISSAMCRNYD